MKQNGNGISGKGFNFTIVDGPGSIDTRALGINDGDEVVGWYSGQRHSP